MAQTRWQRARVGVGRWTLRYRAAWPPALPPPPVPEPEPGTTTGPPDFVGIGAPRSGSTWWARYLHRQTGIRHRQHKELHWFDRFATIPFTPEDADRYSRYFPRAEGELAGEWTPGYLYQPWTPELLRAVAPRTKLVVILRDPLEQIESSINYSHTVHGAPANPLMITRHLGEAGYHHHLRQWEAAFDVPMLVLQYERCLDAPRDEMVRTLEFLELDTGALQPDRPRRPERPSRPIILTERTRAALVEQLTSGVVDLIARHPEVDVARWPNFSHLA